MCKARARHVLGNLAPCLNMFVYLLSLFRRSMMNTWIDRNRQAMSTLFCCVNRRRSPPTAKVPKDSMFRTRAADLSKLGV